MAGSRRYRYIGRVYDAVSMERLLYAAPRRRLLSLIGPMPAATIVDVGCGTGLNFAGLRQLVGLEGRIVGIDASPSMLAAAGRRVSRAGWANVTTIEGDADDLIAALQRADLLLGDIDVIIATFVISIVGDDASFWDAVDNVGRHRRSLIALADLGPPTSTGWLRRIVVSALAALGGSRRSCQPWKELAARSHDVIVEAHLGGHVRLAVGHCGGPAPG